MKKSAAIIGKGPSIKLGSSEYLSSFDDIIICNKPVYKGYEKFIPKKAKIQFRNSDAENFTKLEIKNMGLKKIVYTDWQKNRQLPEFATTINCSQYLKNNIFFPKEYEFYGKKKLGYCIKNKNVCLDNPSTGIIALTCIVMSAKYDKVTIIGLDLNEQNESVYYFNTDEYESHEKIKLGRQYTESGIQKEKVIHANGEQLKKYILYLFAAHSNINFEIISTNNFYKTVCSNLKNVKFI